jgi:hypothetical protein
MFFFSERDFPKEVIKKKSLQKSCTYKKQNTNFCTLWGFEKG